MVTAQRVLAKKAHIVVIDAAVEATCNSTGLTEGNHCSVCNATLVAQRVTIKLTHNLSVKITDIPETCTDDGTYYIECTLCHIILERGTLEGGHNYESTVIPPTASAQGYTQHVCERCNDTYTDTIVPALGFTGLAYVINEDRRTCTITGLGSVTATEIAVPLEIDGYKVTAIGDKAFANCTALTKILLQDNISSIGARAFYGCTGLTEFTIPKNVRTFGTQIFYKASNLKTIYYNSNFGGGSDNTFLNNNSIEKVVFGGQSVPSSICENCSALKEIIILGSVTTIGGGAFENCDNIIEITIPSSVTKIGLWAISKCANLERVEILTTAFEIGAYTFRECPKLKTVCFNGTIEEWINLFFPLDASPCQNGANLYIQGDLLTKVIFSDTITSITQLSFDGCITLESVLIPDSVVSIMSDAFNGCRNLSTVYYGGTVADWENITIEQKNTFLTSASRYYYSESQPTDTTYQYWHYVDGVPTPW